jgi:hypothetical protein
MTNSAQRDEADAHTTSKSLGGSPPVIQTVIRGNSTQPGGNASRSQVPKAGRSKALALFIIPGLVLLALIFAYWFLTMMKSNAEQHSRLRSATPVTAVAYVSPHASSVPFGRA